MNKLPLKKSSIFKLLKKIDITKLDNEIISIAKSLNRFLAKDIRSRINLPPFNNSAVDGYALLKKDIIKKNIKLTIQTRITAGDKKIKKLSNGNVARIFTGARMPLNSNTVIMQENVERQNNIILIKKTPVIGENCRLTGEDIAKGKKIFSRGEVISSKNINLLAAIGKKNILVKERIRVGFYTSGNELKKPTENLKDSQINNSNYYSMNALLDQQYIHKRYLGVLKDNENLIKKTLLKDIKKFNVIITTGGASVGEEDHLVKVIKKIGKVYFWKAAIKPGRPLAIGKIKNTIIICLPGNPVSVHLLYAMIINPFIIYLCTGKMNSPMGIKVKANFSMKKKHKRLEWLRVNIKEYKGELIANKFLKQGSGMISSVVFSDGILEIPENIKKISKGDSYLYYSFHTIFK